MASMVPARRAGATAGAADGSTPSALGASGSSAAGTRGGGTHHVDDADLVYDRLKLCVTDSKRRETNLYLEFQNKNTGVLDIIIFTDMILCNYLPKTIAQHLNFVYYDKGSHCDLLSNSSIFYTENRSSTYVADDTLIIHLLNEGGERAAGGRRNVPSADSAKDTVVYGLNKEAIGGGLQHAAGATTGATTSDEQAQISSGTTNETSSRRKHHHHKHKRRPKLIFSQNIMINGSFPGPAVKTSPDFHSVRLPELPALDLINFML